MQSWFADTFYFLALRNPKDEAHASAIAVTAKLGSRRVFTTTWVLTEVADALAKPVNRAGFAELMNLLAANPNAVIVAATQELFEQGVAFYHAHTDKDWSLTDCISFVVMKQQGIGEALTGDHHFEQVGFTALLK